MTDEKPRVNIVVTSWNAIEYTKITIDRIFKTISIPYYLTIVDNGSNEETVEYIKSINPASQFCKDIIKVYNNKNMGPGFAFNQGYHSSVFLDAEFTCLCNNDLYFWSGWLESLLQNMDNNSTLGLVGPLRISEYTKHYAGGTTREVFNSTPPLSPLEEMSYFFKTKDHKNGVKRLIKANGGGIKLFDRIPASIPSHCVLVKNEALSSMGFIADPIYKTYGSDDIDLCWELLNRGWKIAIDKNTYVHHFRHKSVIDNELDKQKELYINTQKFIRKWKNTIKQLIIQDDFVEKFADHDNEAYSILRHMNQKTGLIDGFK